MKRSEYLAFAANLARESSVLVYQVADTADRLCRIGQALDGLAVAVCHGDLTEKQKSRFSRLKGEARGLCYTLGAGFEAIYQGDPRGCVLKIKLPSGDGDGYDNAGTGLALCVPYGR
jgi:hypothetical protein